MSGKVTIAIIREVQEKLGYSFIDFNLLVIACTYVPVKNGGANRLHRKDRPITKQGWELETIGDAILLTIVRQRICPILGVTEAHRIISYFVSNENLRICGTTMGLPNFNSAADRVEAIIGATWIDTNESGKEVRKVVERILSYGKFNYQSLKCD